MEIDSSFLELQTKVFDRLHTVDLERLPVLYDGGSPFRDSHTYQGKVVKNFRALVAKLFKEELEIPASWISIAKRNNCLHLDLPNTRWEALCTEFRFLVNPEHSNYYLKAHLVRLFAPYQPIMANIFTRCFPNLTNSYEDRTSRLFITGLWSLRSHYHYLPNATLQEQLAQYESIVECVQNFSRMHSFEKVECTVPTKALCTFHAITLHVGEPGQYREVRVPGINYDASNGVMQCWWREGRMERCTSIPPNAVQHYPNVDEFVQFVRATCPSLEPSISQELQRCGYV